MPRYRASLTSFVLLGYEIVCELLINSSFTDSPLITLPTSFLRKTPEVAPGHNTDYSYAHAHIAQIKIQENIASMSLTILVRDFQPYM